MIAAIRRAARTWWARRTIARSGLFDRAWYLRHYPDVAAAGIDPLLHYVLHGHAEGFFPNPLFDSRWYRARYGADAPAGPNPLIAYIRHGAAAAHRPNRWFDAAWYAQRTAVPVGDALRHYREIGAARGFETSPDLCLAAVTRRRPGLGGHATPLGCFLHDFSVTGALGDCTAYFVSGWAYRRAEGPIVLTIHVNGVAQGQVTPWLDRPDVRERRGIAGRGYFFTFPVRLAAGDTVEIKDEFGTTVEDCVRVYAIPALDAPSDFHGARAAIAATFLHGRGIEVGAFHMPTSVPPDRDVAFYDRFPTDVLRRHYDETCGRPLMEPTFIGEAETLDGLADGAFDFLIANHVIEHLQDPIHFLEAVAAKLGRGGRAMIAAPDKRFTFDIDRALTPFAHLEADHEHGPQSGQYAHFLEWAQVGMKLDGDAAHAAARSFDADTTLFHYHVWDAETFVAFVRAAIARFAIPLDLVYSASTTFDITVVLEKTA